MSGVWCLVSGVWCLVSVFRSQVKVTSFCQACHGELHQHPVAWPGYHRYFAHPDLSHDGGHAKHSFSLSSLGDQRQVRPSNHGTTSNFIKFPWNCRWSPERFKVSKWWSINVNYFLFQFLIPNIQFLHGGGLPLHHSSGLSGKLIWVAWNDVWCARPAQCTWQCVCMIS